MTDHDAEKKVNGQDKKHSSGNDRSKGKERRYHHAHGLSKYSLPVFRKVR